MSGQKKCFFTPCRSVGLQRKSLSNCSPEGLDKSSENTENVPSNSLQSVIKSILYTESRSPKETSITGSKTIHENRAPRTTKNLLNRRSFRRRGEKNSFSIVKNTTTDSENEKKKTIGEGGSGEALNPENISTRATASEEEIYKIKKRISEKRTEVEYLQMEIINTRQHHAEPLEHVIQKWKLSCQQALIELHKEYKKHESDRSMTDVLHFLGIPLDLVGYSETELDFYE